MTAVAELGETAVCTCGSPYLTRRGPRCACWAPCPGCAALQQQIDVLREDFGALDRGLIAATEAAGAARDAAASLQGHVDAQGRAWKAWRDVAGQIEEDTAPVPVPQPRSGLYAVPSGGAA